MYTQISIKNCIMHESLFIEAIEGHMRIQKVKKMFPIDYALKPVFDLLWPRITFNDLEEQTFMHYIIFYGNLSIHAKNWVSVWCFSILTSGDLLVTSYDLLWPFMTKKCKFIYLISFLIVICVYMLKIKYLCAFNNAQDSLL